MKPKKLFTCLKLSIIIFLSSCASVQSSFCPEVHFSTKPKTTPETVQFLRVKPSRLALRIGSISTNGNGFANFDDLIDEGKQKAAQLGGDFILVENSGINKQTYYSPGYSTYQSNAVASYGNQNGYGSGQANGYSVGPSVSTINFPWCTFSVWVYHPSKLGLTCDENNIVSGFHLNTDAEEKGVEIGDKIIGINGFDITDQKLLENIMTIRPGNKINLTLQRGAKKISYQITAIPNL